MNSIYLKNRAFARVVAVYTVVSLVFSAFIAPFSVPVAQAASTSKISAAVLAEPAAAPEYFEIEYTGSVNLDLTNWSVQDGASFDYQFGAVVLTDGDTYRVCQNAGSQTGCDANTGSASSAWNDDGDTLTLRDKNNNVILTFTFGDVAEDEVVSDSTGNLNVLADKGGDKIDICHATASQQNPYNAISPNLNSFFGGHDKETEDIIPPFYYNNGNGLEFFPGNHWDNKGQEILRNKCVDPNTEPAPLPVNIVATKIVCSDESLLPNDGYTSIDADTATDFLAGLDDDDKGKCWLEEGWEFQWALGGVNTANAPDNDGVLAGPWNTTNPTDENGKTSVSITPETLGNNTTVSVREVMDAAYIPFTGKNGSNVSAEIYCHTDAANYDNLDWIKSVAQGETYYCVAWNVPKTSDVTMCKIDDEQNLLSGWQLSLLGEKVGESTVKPDGSLYTISGISAGDYVLKATGAYVYRSGGYGADAAFSERKAGDEGFGTYPYNPWRETNPLTQHLGVRVDGDALVWGSVYSPSHTYYTNWNPVGLTNEVELNITDTQYTDNKGDILVEAFAGFTGVTEDDGCVTFENVPYGTYEVEELLQPSWENEDGLGELVVDEPQVTHYVTNRDISEVPTAELVATKIVCTDEADLPNGNVSTIGATTAIDWVNTHASCSFESGWEFEWAPQGTPNPDNDLPENPLYGTAGGDWTTFGPTDVNGTVSALVTEDVVNTNTHLWVREVLQDGYIPFTYGPGHMTNADDYTAELYCNTDAKNFDNYDRVDGLAVDQTYYCVAWNHEIERKPVVSDVAICKYDETGAPLAGWTLMLQQDHVEDVVVAANDMSGTDTVSVLTGGAAYIAKAIGSWFNAGGNSGAGNEADAEYVSADAWTTHTDGPALGVNSLDLQVNENFVDWGTYTSAHTYATGFTGADDVANFRVFDGTGVVPNAGWYADNNGSIDVSVYGGYVGVTDKDGCVYFDEVPQGEYVIDEIMQDGWHNVSGLGPVVVDEAEEVFEVVNSDYEAAPYCGDGVVNQEWEQCDGGEGCANYCLYENQCHDQRLAKITFDNVESTSFDGMVYLGSATNAIPSGTWFMLDEAGDEDVDDIADVVDGLAVERNQDDSRVKVAFRGANVRKALDIVSGEIELLGAETWSSSVERFILATDYKLEPEDGTGGFPDVFAVQGDNMGLDFDMRADTGNDGASFAFRDGDEYDCPTCHAGVEARIVLAEGGYGNAGDGNLNEKVFLADGTEVAFGEWFPVYDGTDFINDPVAVETYGNTTDDGLFVSRQNGVVKVALVGEHHPGGNTNHEYIHGYLEFRDADIVPGSAAGLAAGYVLENHSEVDGIPSNDGFDTFSEIDSQTVAFNFWVDTASDGIKVTVDPESIATCDEDSTDDTDNDYRLTIEITGDGFGTILSSEFPIQCSTIGGEEEVCEMIFEAGTVVDLEALPDTGSNFNSSWTVGAGTCTGNNTPCAVTMNSDIDLVAHFALDDVITFGGPTGGNGKKISLSSAGRTGGSDDGNGAGGDLPEGQVLGEQVSVVPTGAPNAGAGGAATSGALVAVVLAAAAALSTRRTYAK